MVEAGADGVTEAEILDALDIAHAEIKKLVAAIEELRSKAGKEKLEVEAPKVDEELIDVDQGSHGAKLDEATQIAGQARAPGRDRRRRGGGHRAVRRRPARARRPTPSARPRSRAAFAKLEKDIDPQAHRGRQEAPRRSRPGRDPPDRDRGRHLTARPRLGAVHPRRDADPLQRRAGHDPDGHEGRQPRPPGDARRFWHHYNFPPFSVGEAGFMRGPKRRDIGHGALAERALAADDPGRGGVSRT